MSKDSRSELSGASLTLTSYVGHNQYRIYHSSGHGIVCMVEETFSFLTPIWQVSGTDMTTHLTHRDQLSLQLHLSDGVNLLSHVVVVLLVSFSAWGTLLCCRGQLQTLKSFATFRKMSGSYDESAGADDTMDSFWEVKKQHCDWSDGSPNPLNVLF